MKLLEIINGTLLGDASIECKEGKYYYYSLVSKSKEFLEWVKKFFLKYGIKPYILLNNYTSKVYMLGFYINAGPYKELLHLRDKWYKEIKGKTVKVVPRDLELTPTTLLFWYLGDGSLIRRRNDETRVPHIAFATNGFSKKDVKFLREKLKEIGLNFYIVKDRSLSGFRKKRRTSYLLYSCTQDETVFKFFKYIGDCPKEIENCVIGNRGGKIRYFRDKWPYEEDWIKILSNVKEIGKILRERRIELGYSQSNLAKIAEIKRETLKNVELMERRFGVKNLKKVLNTLKLNVKEILRKLF